MNDYEHIRQAYKDIVAGKAKSEDFIFKLSTQGLEALEKMLADRRDGIEAERKACASKDLLKLSQHAIVRIRERIFPGEDKTDEDIIFWFARMQLRGNLSKAAVDKKKSVLQLLNHRLEKADYYIDGAGFIYVVVGQTVKTVHHNEAKRFSKAS